VTVAELKADCIELQARIIDLELARERLKAIKIKISKKYGFNEVIDSNVMLKDLLAELGRLTVKE
jgi:hypothetical protein